MPDDISHAELELLISSLDQAIAVLEAKLKRARAENRHVAQVLRELNEVRARRDRLLDDLGRLPSGGQV